MAAPPQKMTQATIVAQYLVTTRRAEVTELAASSREAGEGSCSVDIGGAGLTALRRATDAAAGAWRTKTYMLRSGSLARAPLWCEAWSHGSMARRHVSPEGAHGPRE